MVEDVEFNPPAKRRKLNTVPPKKEATTSDENLLHKGLDRPISPPFSRRESPMASKPAILAPNWVFNDVPQPTPTPAPTMSTAKQSTRRVKDENRSANYVPSPIQLTRINDLAPYQNVDTVRLKDILGDPMIKECWNFNFLFDLDFVMNQFDVDVKNMVKVRIIHGFWKNDDERRIGLLETAERYPNVELLHAYIPDPFGTHHTKMLVLFRHDGFAQVIIHTANMISRDWGNMTQAVWRSPLLPLLPSTSISGASINPIDAGIYSIGSGERFKLDLLRYLKAYGNRVKNLTTELAQYDFSAVRAAFIGSAPSRQKSGAAQPSTQTSFGWLGLQEILSVVPITARARNAITPPHIVIQISSIATLGAVPTWLTHFQSVLAQSTIASSISTAELSTSSTKTSNFFMKHSTNVTERANKLPAPKYSIVFPTPEEIRTSLDGYDSGASIHVKLQSAQQQKQIKYLHPLLCRWKPPAMPWSSTSSAPNLRKTEALRGPAAPHIKTYIRFSDENQNTIDWAMITSANLSKQAWGDLVNKKDEIWIQSWEAGVVVWPALFSDTKEEQEAVMVPVFGMDLPEAEELDGAKVAEDKLIEGHEEMGEKTRVVGFRMPYDLPLSPYAPDDKPWCATMQYREPDWKGQAWVGY